jgi:chromosome segregation ATPase
MKRLVIIILLVGIFPVINSCSDSIRSDNHDELQRLYQELRDLKVEISELQEQQTILSNNTSSIEKELNGLNATYLKSKERFIQLQSKIIGFEANLLVLKEEESDILIEIKNIETIIKDAIDILESTEDTELYNQYSLLLQESYEKLASLEDQLEEKQLEIAEMDANIESLKEQLAAEQASLEEEYQKEKSRLEAEIKKQDAAKAELKKKLDELLARKEEIEEKIKHLTGS